MRCMAPFFPPGRRPSARFVVLLLALPLTLALTVAMPGCAAPPSAAGSSDYSALYNAGQFEAAYRTAASAAGQRNAADRHAAAYVAGLSGQRLARFSDAEQYFRQASQSRDAALRGDALASLGLLHHRTGDYAAAARELIRAAELLGGADRARAYFYAGISQQKLDRWSQARTSLLLARGASRDDGLTRRINEQLAVTGYTIQIGAFSGTDNARRIAEQIAGRTEALRMGSPRLVPSRTADGQSLTLVQIGTFSSYQSAHDARNRLDERSAIIVPLTRR